LRTKLKFAVALLSLSAISCSSNDDKYYSENMRSINYDGCEYIYINDMRSLTHKGNCKGCISRENRNLENWKKYVDDKVRDLGFQ